MFRTENIPLCSGLRIFLYVQDWGYPLCSGLRIFSYVQDWGYSLMFRTEDILLCSGLRISSMFRTENIPLCSGLRISSMFRTEDKFQGHKCPQTLTVLFLHYKNCQLSMGTSLWRKLENVWNLIDSPLTMTNLLTVLFEKGNISRYWYRLVNMSSLCGLVILQHF